LEVTSSAASAALRRRLTSGSVVSLMRASAEIALAAIAEDGDDALAELEAARDFDRGVDVRARGWAEEQPLFAREAAGHALCREVRNGHDVVDERGVEDLRHEARAEALDAVQARLATREHGARARLHGDDPHVRIALLEHPRDARERAAGPGAG